MTRASMRSISSRWRAAEGVALDGREYGGTLAGRGLEATANNGVATDDAA
jgi:hypothetical protein